MRLGGTWGCGGKNVDAIDHLTQKIQRLDERIDVRSFSRRGGVERGADEEYR